MRPPGAPRLQRSRAVGLSCQQPDSGKPGEHQSLRGDSAAQDLPPTPSHSSPLPQWGLSYAGSLRWRRSRGERFDFPLVGAGLLIVDPSREVLEPLARGHAEHIVRCYKGAGHHSLTLGLRRVPGISPAPARQTSPAAPARPLSILAAQPPCLHMSAQAHDPEAAARISRESSNPRVSAAENSIGYCRISARIWGLTCKAFGRFSPVSTQASA